MTYHSLSERVAFYEQNSQKVLLPSLPVVVSARGRNFKRLCKNVERPLSKDLAHALALAAFYAVKEMQGIVFCYQYSDKFYFILTNGKNHPPWLCNHTEEISSITSSLLTKGFEKAINSMELDIVGDAIFSANTFNLPRLSEVINYLIAKQNDAKKYVIDKISKYHLIQKIGRREALSLIDNKSFKEKQDLLKKYCQISIEDYASLFWKGYGLYKIPILISNPDETIYKNKWHLNDNLISFSDDKYFLSNILKNGHDIFREIV